jgi:hypothetical protein
MAARRRPAKKSFDFYRFLDIIVRYILSPLLTHILDRYLK